MIDGATGDITSVHINITHDEDGTAFERMYIFMDNMNWVKSLRLKRIANEIPNLCVIFDNKYTFAEITHFYLPPKAV
jgi:hypothetical protein